MNVKLLEKVRKHILQEPKRVSMSDWLINPFFNAWKLSKYKEEKKLPACNTIGCIAGWTLQLTSRKKLRTFDSELAQKKLGLNWWEASRLFYLSKMDETYHWPKEFEKKLEKTKQGTRAYARVVAARIKHFIKTEGRE